MMKQDDRSLSPALEDRLPHDPTVDPSTKEYRKKGNNEHLATILISTTKLNGHFMTLLKVHEHKKGSRGFSLPLAVRRHDIWFQFGQPKITPLISRILTSQHC